MKKVLKNKKYLFLFILLAVVTVTTVSKLSKSSLFTSLRKNKTDYTEVKDGDNSIDGSTDVTFDVYFLKDKNNDGEAEGYRGSKIEYGKQDKLYFDLNVSGNAILKDGSITFDNKNVKIGGVLAKSSVIPSTLSSTDYRKINLGEVSPGTSSFFYLNVSPYIENDLNYFSGTNRVIFRGTIVNNVTGLETPVEKVIEYDIDTYSTKISTSINETKTSGTINNTSYEDKNLVNISYTVQAIENYDAMPMKASYLLGSVSNFEGYHPVRVTVTSGDGYPIDFEYDSETQKFTAVRRAIVDENNIITRQAYNTRNGSIRYNKWYINVTYEVGKEDVLDNKTASINVKAYNTGFSNIDLDEVKSNEVNKVLSHIISVRPPITIPAFTDKSKIYIGTYANSIQNYFVDKTFLENVYLGTETGNFKYNEYWNLNTTTDRETELTYKENGTRLGNTSIISFQTYKSLKVTDTPNVSNYKISIYNGETNELLYVITKDNVNDEFEFPSDVKIIKVITNKLPEWQTFRMNLKFEKEIDSRQLVNYIPLNTFATFGTISNSGRVYQKSYSTLSNPYNGNATFSDTYSNAKLTTTKQSFVREISETSIPMNYTIKHNNVDGASKAWNKGFYLLKLPKEVIAVENLNISPSSMIVSSEVIEKEGYNYIKIITNNPSTSSNPNIGVNFNAVVDPKETQCSGYVEMYAINNVNTLYNSGRNDIYDADGDGITTEKAAYSSIYISVTAPNELLTGAIIKNYDDKGSQTISPLIADIDPTKGDSDATVNVFLINNSSFNMKNIVVVGKLAYLNNTYEGIAGNLGSEYDVELSGPIQVPSTLNGKATIYYSTNKTPTKDLTDTSNGWTTEVSDYSTIKSYMIVIDDSIQFRIGDTYDFEFPVNMPNTTANLLKVTYFNHGVYFDRITDEGSVAGHVTAPKLGVRMARKYDLDLDVFRAFSNNKVPSGQYILTDEDGVKQTISLDNTGHALAKGLYVGKEYTLKQHSAPYKYVVDTEERRFKVENKNDDSLELSYDGNYRKIEYNDVNQLKVELDMELLYTLDLHNIDSESNSDIKNTIFKITGKNHENGINITTDSEGHAYLSDMELGEIYKVEQIKIDGYAKVDTFNIKIERDSNTHEIKILKEEYPTITKANCHQIFNTFDGKYLSSNAGYKANNGNFKCNLEIDLTKFRDNYKLTGYAYLQDYIDSSNNPNASFSLVKGEQNVVATPFLSLAKSGSSTGWRTFSQSFAVTKAYEKNGNTYNEIDFKGGSKYYLLVNYNHGRYYTSNPNSFSSTRVYMQSLQVRSTNSNAIEFVFQDEKENVNPKDNNNVSQTLRYYSVEETNNPILEVEVKNKYISKGTLKITKTDGETGEKLSGAQYKITGPGLPEKGKYITIDEEGNGSIDLYLSYTGATYYIPGINNNYPLTNYYTIEEVIPPTGYSLDDKPVTFNLVANALYDSNTQELTYEYRLNYDSYSRNNNKFPSYEIDRENKIWNVTMEDFPIVKVTKKDEETNEILPNTYYAVYKIERVDGIEKTEFAKDSEGNYIGEKLTIDDKEYYVIKTDDTGSFSLNLPTGQYQLKEIQAADDKYEISDQITYFGVGETIPYQAAGVTLKRAKSVINAPFNENNAKIYNLSDGGYLKILFGNNGNYGGQIYLVKYDHDFNVKWIRSYTAQYKYDYYYYYFDDPDRVTKVTGYTGTDNYIYYAAFKETDEGFYLGLDYNDLFLIDKDTGDILKHSSEINPGRYTYTFQNRCTVSEGQTTANYSEEVKVPGSDTEYYCNTSSSIALNYWSYYDYEPHITFGDDGYVYVISKLYANGGYGFYLHDGTKIVPEAVDTTYSNSYISQYYLLKMDIEGNVYEATNLSEKFNDALSTYVSETYPDLNEQLEYFLSNNYHNYYSQEEYTIPKGKEYIPYYKNMFKVLPNGEIAFVINAPLFDVKYKTKSTNSTTGEETYNNSTFSENLNMVVFMDSNYNIKRIIPLSFNGSKLYISSNSNYVDNEIWFNDDGSFEYSYPTTYKLGNDDNGLSFYAKLYKYLFTTEQTNFDLNYEEGHPNGYYSYIVLRWDKNGKADKVIELSRNQRDPNYYDTTNDMKRVYHYYESYISLVKVDGGYVVASPIAYKDESFYNTEAYRTVELASGEVVRFNENTTYIVYKVNEEDSSIEWLKQYGNIYSNRYSVDRINLVDNKFILYKYIGPENVALSHGATDGGYISSINDLKHADINPSTYTPYAFLEFELLDEVAPEAPKSTTINLTNKRKEYKVNVESNEGGRIVIIDEENDVVHEGEAPGLVEKIKYGDDELKTIKVVPNSGFEIKKITVNGENADITVNNDGSVVINKFTNVTEDKNINVIFERGMSRVTVHHYLKGTTDKILPDELLTGRIESKYITEAKITELYNLAKDTNDEYILPLNANGVYTLDPIEVIYYYEPNLVRVKTNFYLKDSNISLADSVVSTVILGSDYNTTPAEIPHYTVVDVLGVTSGVALDELTEVTYFYENTSTGTVIIKYVDEETNEEISKQKIKVLMLGEEYTTSKLNITPRGYRYSHSSDNTTGYIMEADKEITVYYYYSKIKPVVTTRYVDYKTNKDISEKVIEEYNYDDEYTTHELEEVPKEYKLKEVPSNYKGIADREEIEVIYYYIKTEVKDEEEVPNTNDNIIDYLVLILMSGTGLIITYKLKQKNN